ncbi:hypothetical protein LXT12_05585 [Pelomonas sp. P7]|uniref:FimV N-terminal domain-containing protein n=2 Tax=Roseateles TaxID=93681 RepID=A0ABS8XE35_9BURK|nr:hypothetical protein [Pelomonas sp. P7]MCE4536721.1 hypothetical protein [Pelomonas sp. P7]
MALLLGLAPQGAQALGVGRPQVQSALGKPLDVSLPLTLADGEALSDGCLRAEVMAGDARVPAGLLQLRVEGEPGDRRIRLRSVVPVEEPALRITLALGCPVRLTREFNAFVDPPASAAAPAAAQPAPAPAPMPAAAVPAEPPRAVAEAPAAPRPRPPRRTRPQASGPRLVLERPEVLVSQAPQRPAAASAPEMELTPELEAQISQLEQTVAQLKAELEARQAASAAASMPASAAVAATPPASVPTAPVVAATVPSPHVAAYRDPWTWLLTLGLGLVAGTAAFRAGRWMDQRSRRETAYWRALEATAEGAAVAPPPTPASPGMAPSVQAGTAYPLPDEGQHTATRPQPRPMAWPPPPPAMPPVPVPARGASTPDPAMMATQPLPVQAAAAPVLSQELAVADELLDLQQQLDFLLLLGQHEAAAELLATRIRQGAGSPMPHLMLMELCQQRGEPEAFAELARQFAQRFRLPVPAWEHSLSQGRTLDACTSVIAHIQVAWADPAAAMQLLQTLLAQGGGPGVPSFELPSYRDLLTLYGVARDLYEAGLRSDGVDLMLPLDSQF